MAVVRFDRVTVSYGAQDALRDVTGMFAAADSRSRRSTTTGRTPTKHAPTHVFFYGTLMQGFGLRHQSGIDPLIQFLGRGTVRGVLYDLGTYPALLPGEGTVQGELYTMIDPATLLSLVDAIEGYRSDDFAGSRYVRRVVWVRPLRGLAVSAWLYTFNRRVGDGTWIPSGDYAAHVMGRVQGRR